MLSVALTTLNQALTAAAAPRMRATSLDGLLSTLTDEKIVITEPFEQLEAMIRERRDGSFGIAGPRGVGKTTLIRFFAGGLGLADRELARVDDVTKRRRPRLGVVVSAPVQYQARDFVLHLYAELCKRVAGGDADQAIWAAQVESNPSPGWWAIFPPMVSLGLAVLGAAAVTGGTGLLAWAINRRLRAATHVFGDVGAALVGAAAVLLVIVLFQALKIFLAGRRLIYVGPAAEPESYASDIGINAPVKDPGMLSSSVIWRCAAMSTLTVAGISLMILGGGWPGGAWPLLGGAALVAVGIPALWMVRRSSRLNVYLRIAPDPLILSELEPSRDTQLRELALDHLRQIRFQQSYTSERSLTAKFSGPTPLPVGLDVTGKRGTTWEERPKTYPELVADLRAFQAAAGEKYELVMGVDELDKLHSPEAVKEFLNDIKGIFGAAGCFYLVSVSEDAAASFDRRGAPFRDVFDSSFDDIVSVQHLDLASARKILHSLLLGWTEPFVGLCYVLSGGLARDLWRVARQLVAQRDADNEIELAQAAQALCRREGEARLQAVRYELMRDPFDALNVDLLARIADIALTDATAADMQRWHDDLRAWALSTEVPAPMPTATEGHPARSPIAENASVHPQTARTPASARLALEMAAYLLFAATVLDFFMPTLIGDRLRVAERSAARSKTLATLAFARQSVALSPSSSLGCTERFRKEWNL
jgi:hypothetical protein